LNGTLELRSIIIFPLDIANAAIQMSLALNLVSKRLASDLMAQTHP
jgi:hypothetical protein